MTGGVKLTPPPEKTSFKKPSLIRVKFRCVFIKQKFSICRLDQLKREHIPMKNDAVKCLSVDILQMNKSHLMGYRKLFACL